MTLVQFGNKCKGPFDLDYFYYHFLIILHSALTVGLPMGVVCRRVVGGVRLVGGVVWRAALALAADVRLLTTSARNNSHDLTQKQKIHHLITLFYQ